MKAVIQRVKRASVTVDGKICGKIDKGFLVLLGVLDDDTESDADILAKKTASLRIFTDNDDKMNLSLKDVGGEVLAVSQFTLCADVKKGNRPSFTRSAPPESAIWLYENYCKKLLEYGVKNVEKGIFGADMQVELINDGPVTILYDTEMWVKRC
ncbi:MAG: D-tyrosyl-tRNA(Tyr) deacylase [Oscillospiraceae bacterium]|nr:D-tyrosyl-tRNA(Tyr) deacylase [Oscillospiraceae bacterium]